VGEGPPEPIALGLEISNFKPLEGEGPPEPIAPGSEISNFKPLVNEGRPSLLPLVRRL